MENLLKIARENKNIKTRELAKLSQIDSALINKFENGFRIPTEKQIRILSSLLEIDINTLLVAWYKKKLLNDLDFNTQSIQAVTEILQEKGVKMLENEKKENQIADILFEIENLKSKLINL